MIFVLKEAGIQLLIMMNKLSALAKAGATNEQNGFKYKAKTFSEWVAAAVREPKVADGMEQILVQVCEM